MIAGEFRGSNMMIIILIEETFSHSDFQKGPQNNLSNKIRLNYKDIRYNVIYI